jgi:hypothetical protein
VLAVEENVKTLRVDISSRERKVVRPGGTGQRDSYHICGLWLKTKAVPSKNTAMTRIGMMIKINFYIWTYLKIK